MRKLNFKYLFAFITPVVIFISIYKGGTYAYAALVYVFLLIPFIELFFKGNTRNLTEVTEPLIKKQKFYDILLYSFVPIHYGLFVFYLIKLQDLGLSLPEKFGISTAFGISCGVIGINVAHELGHRGRKFERFLSKTLLLSTQYMHFYIEHNRGHHNNVATPSDPASARYGEPVYFFYFRSIYFGWLSAWKLEHEKLLRKKQSFFSFKNEMLVFQLLQILLIIVILMLFNVQTLLFYLISALIGILLLETVNYIEHYGLQRIIVNNQYESTLPVHSWNSNHPLGRILLFELTRHSDHHYISNRKYQLLRHFNNSPQLPTGYPGMMLLSFLPPIWFYVMHKHIKTYKSGFEKTMVDYFEKGKVRT